MRIKVVNPNTTASMTDSIGACARAVVGPGVALEVVNPQSGPASIESHLDHAASVPGILAEVAAGERDGVDAYVIACFGDPGLMAAREAATGPVVGIAEAAMRTAAYLGRGFSVVTTLARTVGHSEDLALLYGLERQCRGIHATGIGVLELETDPTAYETVRDHARAALAADRSDVVVLGCAGMAELGLRLSIDLGVPVVDGVAAGVAQAEALVRQRLRTSTAGEFSQPQPSHRVGV